MRRLLASDLLPKRAGQPARALAHIHFTELLDMDSGSVLQDKWIEDYRARWAAQRAAASVATGDGGAWLEGDAARQMACDAMIIPVVTGDIYAASWPSATRPAATPAAATSPPRAASRTTWCTARTAGIPA
jgi:hypothetical protein